MSALKILAIPTALLVGTFPLWANEANHHHHQGKIVHQGRDWQGHTFTVKHVGQTVPTISITPVPKRHAITPMLRTKTQAR